MAYRIDYETNDAKTCRKILFFRLPVMTLICLALFFFLVDRFWPEGAVFLNRMTDSFHSIPIVRALEQVAADFQDGEEMLEAFSEFFRTILP